MRRRRSLSWDVDVEPLRERRSEHGYVHSPRRADSRRNRVKESSDSDTRQDRRHVKGTGDKELIVAQSADKDLKHALVCLMKTQRLASDLLVACKARTVKSERKAPAPLTVHVYHHHDGTTDSTTTPVQHRVSSPGNRNGSRVAIVNAKNGEAAPIDIVDDLRVAEGYITTGSARRPVAPSSPPRRASPDTREPSVIVVRQSPMRQSPPQSHAAPQPEQRQPPPRVVNQAETHSSQQQSVTLLGTTTTPAPQTRPSVPTSRPRPTPSR